MKNSKELWKKYWDILDSDLDLFIWIKNISDEYRLIYSLAITCAKWHRERSFLQICNTIRGLCEYNIWFCDSFCDRCVAYAGESRGSVDHPWTKGLRAVKKYDTKKEQQAVYDFVMERYTEEYNRLVEERLLF